MRRSLDTIERIYNATGGDGSSHAHAQNKNHLDVLLREEAEKQKEMEKKMEKLSPYKRVEIKTLLEIAKMRKTLKQIELLNRQGNKPDGDVREENGEKKKMSEQMKYHLESQKLREVTGLKQFCRKQYRVLQNLQKEAESVFYTELNNHKNRNRNHAGKKDNDEEREKEEEEDTLDFNTLNTHIENAISYYRQVFEITVVSSSSGGGVTSNLDNKKQFSTLTQREREQYLTRDRNRKHTSKYNNNNNDEEESLLGDQNREGNESNEQQLKLDYINARDDKEFENFFLLTEQKNKLIDEALDRIHVSVLRLKDNAQFISNELHVQEHLLNQTEVHIEHTQEHVRRLNKRLDVAIKELKTSSVCSYLLCLLFLMFVLCLLLRVAT